MEVTHQVENSHRSSFKHARITPDEMLERALKRTRDLIQVGLLNNKPSDPSTHGAAVGYYGAAPTGLINMFV